jgi:biopolymer transport protein ExbB/TolQ
MSSAHAAAKPSVQPERRTRTTLAAFVLGLPLATGILCAIWYGPFKDTVAARYVEHRAEQVEVVMFCMALGALAAKLTAFVTERRACRSTILPSWHGTPIPVADAAKLLAALRHLPRRLQKSLIVRRAAGALDFLCNRGTADDLDDQLRAQADTDALALEGSYGLIRFITWAVPILGFLGTVLGITAAISGVSPEKLENGSGINAVTGGLSEAFDTTALALALTMITMFLSFLVERAEQSIHDFVDHFAEQELAHRFERIAGEDGKYVEALRRNADVLTQAMETLVVRQTTLWARALEEADRRRSEAEKRQQDLLTTALGKALEHTLDAHAQRLSAQERQLATHGGGIIERINAVATTVRDTHNEQQAALARVTEAITSQVRALAELQQSETQLKDLQETLNRNLETLADAGAFEEALHSLTAAIHLLTARHTISAAGAAGRAGPRPGAAA